MPRKIVKFTIPLLVVTFAVFIVWYLKATKPAIEPAPAIEKVWTIASVTAKAETIRPQIRLFGEIVSGRTVDLRSEVAGKVVAASLHLPEGGTGLRASAEPANLPASRGRRAWASQLPASAAASSRRSVAIWRQYASAPTLPLRGQT